MLMVFKNLFKNISGIAKYTIACIKCNLRSALSNKKSFIIQTIFMFINNMVWLGFWFIIFYNSEGNNINGVTIKDVLYLWSVPTLAFGICFFLFGGVEDLSYMISHKEIDYALTKPKHSLISLVTSQCRLSAMGDIICGLILGIFAVNFDPLKYIFSIFVAVIAAFGFLGICILVQSLAFFLGDISKSARIYTMSLLISLTVYPEKMFTGIIKIGMYTVVPAMYIAHIPIAIIQTYDFKLLIFEIIAIALICTLAVFTYEKGLKKYGK